MFSAFWAAPSIGSCLFYFARSPVGKLACPLVLADLAAAGGRGRLSPGCTINKAPLFWHYFWAVRGTSLLRHPREAVGPTRWGFFGGRGLSLRSRCRWPPVGGGARLQRPPRGPDLPPAVRAAAAPARPTPFPLITNLVFPVSLPHRCHHYSSHHERHHRPIRTINSSSKHRRHHHRRQEYRTGVPVEPRAAGKEAHARLGLEYRREMTATRGVS